MGCLGFGGFFVFCFFLVGLGMESRSFHMLGKHSVTEFPPQLFFFFETGVLVY